MAHVTTGEQIGIEIGIKKATMATALNCLKENIPLEVIARATRLTVAQLQKLQAENR